MKEKKHATAHHTFNIIHSNSLCPMNEAKSRKCYAVFVNAQERTRCRLQHVHSTSAAQISWNVQVSSEKF